MKSEYMSHEYINGIFIRRNVGEWKEITHFSVSIKHDEEY